MKKKLYKEFVEDYAYVFNIIPFQKMNQQQ